MRELSRALRHLRGRHHLMWNTDPGARPSRTQTPPAGSRRFLLQTGKFGGGRWAEKGLRRSHGRGPLTMSLGNQKAVPGQAQATLGFTREASAPHAVSSRVRHETSGRGSEGWHAPLLCPLWRRNQVLQAG